MSGTEIAPAHVQQRKSMPPGRPKSSNPLYRSIAWIWKYEVWIEGITSMGMMELWEKLLCLFVFLTLSSLIWWSVYFYLPGHLRSVIARSSYYIFGTPSNSQKEALRATAEQMIESAKGNADRFRNHADL